VGIKLNIGAGSTKLEGFTPIDRRFGHEAGKLDYEDNTVDEIRASHILEHFSHGEVPGVLAEWVRVLKPGGRIRIAVPDAEVIADMMRTGSDNRWPLYLMGGQTDANDYHKTVFTRAMLEQAMAAAGIIDIEPWTSSNTDCASLPVSLNLEGVKSPQAVVTKDVKLKMRAVMSVPRCGWSDAYACIIDSLRPWNMPIQQFNGVFWGQCMQRACEEAVKDEMDWLLSVDNDSMFTSADVNMLMETLGSNPQIDAIAALQCRRGENEYPLMVINGQEGVDIDGRPFKVDTAHFGLTIIRVAKLAELPKPWFASKCDPQGEWNEGRLDDDIWFWHQWKEAGNTVYVHPQCRIGHLQLMVTEFGEDYKVRHVHVKPWRQGAIDRCK